MVLRRLDEVSVIVSGGKGKTFLDGISACSSLFVQGEDAKLRILNLLLLDHSLDRLLASFLRGGSAPHQL